MRPDKHTLTSKQSVSLGPLCHFRTSAVHSGLPLCRWWAEQGIYHSYRQKVTDEIIWTSEGIVLFGYAGAVCVCMCVLPSWFHRRANQSLNNWLPRKWITNHFSNLLSLQLFQLTTVSPSIILNETHFENYLFGVPLILPVHLVGYILQMLLFLNVALARLDWAADQYSSKEKKSAPTPWTFSEVSQLPWFILTSAKKVLMVKELLKLTHWFSFQHDSDITFGSSNSSDCLRNCVTDPKHFK